MARFGEGQVGNRMGRPRSGGEGRMRVVKAVDRVLRKPENAKTLQEAMEESFKADPIKFVKELAMPLMPKEAKARAVIQKALPWNSVLGVEGQK